MALPSSRNTTYVPGVSQVKSADLNAIQDCIIGVKHPEIERGYAAAAWQTDGTNGIKNNVGGAWTVGGTGVESFTTGLPEIPAGDRITTVGWSYSRGGAGTVTMRLRRRKSDGSAPEAITPSAGSETDSTGAAIETNVVTYNHTVAAGYFYYLTFATDNVAQSFLGAAVKHDRL